jgi:hypothetical protein
MVEIHPKGVMFLKSLPLRHPRPESRRDVPIIDVIELITEGCSSVLK